MTRNTLFTVGHSNRELSQFLCLLKEHGIDAVADVRSQPYSRRFPHFDGHAIKNELHRNGIDYEFMGEELGARRVEPECYVDGKARYDLIAKTKAFQVGLQRILESASTYRIALMCAERDPLTCHRTILICRHLRDELQMNHILDVGETETHVHAESRLLDVAGLPSRDLFLSYDELLSDAYDIQAERIAYVERDARSESAVSRD